MLLEVMVAWQRSGTDAERNGVCTRQAAPRVSEWKWQP